ncbi:outer membrane protein/peptidoglycan-associated (lipo)protein [Rivularia sp. PCC 7116]|uniref:BON domain-containing protein n=1 Tax=Rivularia sp. PCC 7116 TaxID=373994 RepID=UPI00029F3F9B|nr:BON domain-containing protein [Rivularia sp. PCC 7116]AFY53549.1 outer membrane protein/peptidoglycan-associated (lipo)protein [Rivularia sp. PCC 7116]
MSESAELNQEEIAQLENFVNLLADLSIVESSKQEQSHTDDCDTKNQSLNSWNWRKVRNSYIVSPIDIGDDEEYFAKDNKSSNNSNTIYLEAQLDFPQTQSTSYQEIAEEIDVEISPLEQNSEASNQFNQDNSEETVTAVQKLQNILVGDELEEIKKNLQNLNHQLYDSDELIKLLLPQIAELLKRKISESKEEVVEAVTPIIDNAIHSRVEQNKESMGAALAAAVPVAIAEQITVNSGEVAEAIAPAMGEAIQKQIELEKDKIVDALYPVIGNTISKYMGETIQAINQQIENTLSVEGIKRKIRAKLQGVSEAELIVKESISFTPQAIFLIHKTSGLVICDIQPSDSERLESDMIAGMLTAIRSFANDCMIQSGNVSELDEIDYGNFKIILEVAGYCYLAIIVKGEVPKKFVSRMRQVLSTIITSYSKSIEHFEGDLETIPNKINMLLEGLADFQHQKEEKQSKISPLLVLSLSIVGIIFIPLGIWQYNNSRIRSVENKTALALASAPELSVYRIDVKADGDKLKLKGRVPNNFLKTRAKQIVASTAPNWNIDNQIISVEIPASPVLAQAEIKRVTAILNQINGTAISADYSNGRVAVVGSVSKIADAQKITQAFEKIPGVQKVSSAVEVKPVSIPIRFYFKSQSANLVPKDLENKIMQVRKFLNQHPMKTIKIIGYSYSNNEAFATKELALQRAKSVQQALIQQGISPSRMQVIGKTSLPPGIDETQPSWLMRCVVLEPIIQNVN